MSDGGVTPLDVLIENMRWAHTESVERWQDVLARLENGLTKDQIKSVAQIVRHVAGLRKLALDCAAGAAPYMHPRLQAIEHSGEVEHRTVKELSDDELMSIAAGSGTGASKAKAGTGTPNKLH